MSHDPKIGVFVRRLRPKRTHHRRRLVHWLVGEFEGAPVCSRHYQSLPVLPSRKLDHRLDTIFRIHMYCAHEPTRFVSTDGKNCQVERPTTSGDCCELGMQCSIAGKKHGMLSRAQHPTRPQCFVAPAERSAGKVLRGHTREVKIPDRAILPPVAFVHFSRSTPLEERAEFEWSVPNYRRITLGKS